jgi:hypothetical protein
MSVVPPVPTDPRASPPRPAAGDLVALQRELRQEGLRGALTFLNARTPHRYTGVFRFDGEMLRSVLLVDKHDAGVERGDDVPLSQAFCSVVHATQEPLEIVDGRTDPRYPQLRNVAVVSYCGTMIRDGAGQPFGALCHYDMQPCQTRLSDMPLLVAATPLIYQALAVSAS